MWLAAPRAWRTGDMILFRTTDVIFRLSSIITRSEFSHIGVVVAPPARRVSTGGGSGGGREGSPQPLSMMSYVINNESFCAPCGITRL